MAAVRSVPVISRERKHKFAKSERNTINPPLKNLTAIIRLVENLGNYLTESARERLLAITMLQNGPEAEHIEYLVALKRQTDTLTEKLTALRGLNVFSLQEQQNVREVLTAEVD